VPVNDATARFGKMVVLLLGVGAMVSAPRAVDAADAAWLDMEGQIQYDFYTEDIRALTNLTEQLAGREADRDVLRMYYAGLANYRLSLLLVAHEKGSARNAVERCVTNLDGALQQRADFAEALALHSACLATLVSLNPWTAPLAGARSTAEIERAAKLAPKNPRVLLIHAMGARRAGKPESAALEEFRKAVAAFETERQGIDRTPGWGAAEAYAYLGQGYLDKGDVVAARDALERALLIAPDFALARRLVSRITAG
jgi:tetratricopeptide (TPR) repeat protein